MSAGADECERPIMRPVTTIASYYMREKSIGSSSLGVRCGSLFLNYSDCRNERPNCRSMDKSMIERRRKSRCEPVPDERIGELAGIFYIEI